MASLYERGGVWYVKFRANGKVERRSTGTGDRAEAERYMAWLVGDTKKIAPTLGELTQLVVDDYRSNGLKTLDKLEERLKLHILPAPMAALRADRVTEDHLRQYVAARQRAGAKNATINRELAIIKRAYTLGSHLVRQPPRVPHLKENNAKRGFFEPAQFKAALACMPASLRPPLTFAYITGWRIRSEVMPLQWDQVDFEGGVVHLWDSKNGRRRVFPLDILNLRETLRTEWIEAPEDTTDVWWRTAELRKTAGTGVVKEFRKSWAAAIKASGIQGHRTPHDFRRSACRNLIRAGIPERIAMKLVGWESRQMLDRYNIVDEAELVAQAVKLDAHLGPILTPQLRRVND